MLLGALFLGLLATPLTAAAATFRSSDERLTVPIGTVIEDDYYGAAETVAIDGVVNGDVFAAGSTVRITGTVNGDVWIGAGNAEITGSVTGNVRHVGGSLEIRGTVGKDLFTASSEVNVSAGSIGRDVWAGAGTIVLGSPIGRDVHVDATRLELNSTVAGNVKASVGASQESLKLAGGAQIAGNLEYTAKEQITPGSGVVAGRTIYTVDDDDQSLWDRVVSEMYWFLASFLLLAGILFYARRAAWIAAGKLTGSPGWSSLAGFIFLLSVPVLIIILAVSLIGLPLAFFTLMLYLLVLYTAKVFVALLIGRVLLQRQPTGYFGSLGAGTIGLLFLYGLFIIPVVGGVVAVMVALFGAGAQLLLAKELYQDVRAKYGVG